MVRVSAVRVEDRRRDAAATHRHRLVVLLDDGAEHAFLVDDAGGVGARPRAAGVPAGG